MGAVVEKPIKTNNSHIIDYAKKFRTDFLDIYLGAKCDFFVCRAVGIFAIPMVFRRSRVYVNFIPLDYIDSWGSKCISIFKKLWLRRERRFMTFREIFESGVGRFLRTEQYDRVEIEVVENTPDEITQVVVEKDERLKGTWETTEEDEELQRRFWTLFKKSELHGIIKARIGAEFLRQNKNLLD